MANNAFYRDKDDYTSPLRTNEEIAELFYKVNSIYENGAHSADDLFLLNSYNNIRAYSGYEKDAYAAQSTKHYIESYEKYDRGDRYYYKSDLTGLIDIDTDKIKTLHILGNYGVEREKAKKEFLSKTTYVDEEIFSLYDHFFDEAMNISEENRFKIIHYHLKKKKRKQHFSAFLARGYLTDKIVKDLKLTDIQLKDLLFPEFKNLLRRKIDITDLTRLKRFRKIKGAFSDTLIMTIVTQFVKEAEKKNISAAGIEVVLSMFFHYLGLKMEDYPEAELLLTLSLDREMDI